MYILCDVLMCVCNCVPYLQLPPLLVLYWELQIRYPSVAMTIVNCALSAIQHTEEEEGRLKLLETFCENMLVVLNGLQLTDVHSMQIRYDHDRKLTLLIERNTRTFDACLCFIWLDSKVGTQKAVLALCCYFL